MTMPPAPSVREIDSVATHRLRHRLLRPTQDLSDMAYDGDDDAIHLGAFMAAKLVGIASVYPGPNRSWRLRAMAVTPEQRGTGVGAALLEECIARCRSRGATELWCNARTTAMGFYAKAGFVTEGTEFAVAHAGPHFVMRLHID